MTEEPKAGALPVVLDQSLGFWLLIRHAVLLVLAFVSLKIVGVTTASGGWFALPSNPGWLGGSPWWVAVIAAAGVLVAVLRRIYRVPAKLPGTVKEMKVEGRARPRTRRRRCLRCLAVAA